jgi:cytochrome c oxidase cbb3-type subunit 3
MGSEKRTRALCAAGACLIASALGAGPVGAQQPAPVAVQGQEASPPGSLLRVPVTRLFPGAVPSAPDIQNPHEGDPESAKRGMEYFMAMNCNGCHADNGGGGMGPSLSNRTFIYGGQPANIFLSIYQGRPNGMPAWGAVLPRSVIWDLVSYVRKLSNAPAPEWGTTFAQSPQSPNLQQVPSEQLSTPEPWAHTEKFTSGQKP